ncbi:MAG TPA: hypothetical protein VGC66_16800 [Pyrinomonadaceae bacterium]
MMHEGSPLATSRYQDHVIAHVVGATALGYFIIDDAAYVLLDIALVWTIYTDGEMALMPQAVVIHDLEVDDNLKAELMADVERLHRGEADSITRMSLAPAECLIRDVKIYAHGEHRRVVLEGEEASLCIERLPETGEIRINSFQS